MWRRDRERRAFFFRAGENGRGSSGRRGNETVTTKPIIASALWSSPNLRPRGHWRRPPPKTPEHLHCMVPGHFTPCAASSSLSTALAIARTTRAVGARAEPCLANQHLGLRRPAVPLTPSLRATYCSGAKIMILCRMDMRSAMGRRGVCPAAGCRPSASSRHYPTHLDFPPPMLSLVICRHPPPVNRQCPSSR